MVQAVITRPRERATLELQDTNTRLIEGQLAGHHESATMRMILTHITPVLAAGAAALAIAAAPTAAAEPTTAQIANPSAAVASEVVPGRLSRRWLPRWLSRWFPRQSLRLGPLGLEPVGLGPTLVTVNNVDGGGITAYRLRQRFGDFPCCGNSGGLRVPVSR